MYVSNTKYHACEWKSNATLKERHQDKSVQVNSNQEADEGANEDTWGGSQPQSPPMGRSSCLTATHITPLCSQQRTVALRLLRTSSN